MAPCANLLKRLPSCCMMLLSISGLANAPSLAQGYQPTPNDTLRSLSITADGQVSFHVYAPKATEVKLGGSDIPASLNSAAMVKRDNGVWDVAVGPLVPGAYRYHFVVDGVAVMDPRNPATSESNANSWSLLVVPGSPMMDTRDVPHGSVSVVTYYSKSLQRFRRMHVYTPPGYEEGKGQYPVFYLLHGAWDCDNSWSTVGRAGFILDNLIAAKKAVPMIVVMPAGHTGPFVFSPSVKPKPDEFLDDFRKDIRPYVEQHYRVFADREHRAIAGLSMGGMQTINIAMANLVDYAHVGVFSSGIFELGGGGGPFGAQEGPTWEERNSVALADKSLRSGLKTFWFATGKEDFLIETSRKTVELFKKYGFDVTYQETTGAHTWTNWRDYLTEFAPLLFKQDSK